MLLKLKRYVHPSPTKKTCTRYLLLPLCDGEFVLAEYLGREELLVGEVAGVVLVLVVVAVLGLHLIGGHQHGLLGRAVNVLGQNVASHLVTV